MGYRSEAVLAVAKEEYERIVATGNEDIIDALHEWSDRVYERDSVIVIKWGWIKWYSDYTSIAAVESWFDEMDDMANVQSNLEDREVEAKYQFVRAGEENGDVESRGSIWFGLEVHTQISLPGKLEEDL